MHSIQGLEYVLQSLHRWWQWELCNNRSLLDITPSLVSLQLALHYATYAPKLVLASTEVHPELPTMSLCAQGESWRSGIRAA